MNEDKVEMVRNRRRAKKTTNGRLNNLFEAQQFSGLCNYYRRFMTKC